MGRAYKVVPTKDGSKTPFQLMFLGNFKRPSAFREGIINKHIDGQFCFIQLDEKHFLTIKNGEVIDEEVRYGKKPQGPESRELDSTNRGIGTERDC